MEQNNNSEEKILKNIIETRRSTRLFENKEIPDEEINKILMAGHNAPNAKNLQPWHFVVIKNKKLITKIMTTKLKVRPEGEDMIDNKTDNPLMNSNIPPLLVLIFIEKNKSVFYDPRYYGNIDKTYYVNVGGYSYSDIISIGCAVENMCLAATSLGIGSCITGDVLEDGVGQYIREWVGLDDKFAIISGIRFGYALNKNANGTLRRGPLENNMKVID